ncbi:hypothetical protein Q1695_005087 [Nippostrongylus brasiliensis]|nr:hypothetical protein Q1695_005087 [Nippostrongylus brasiliensis]
MCGASTTPDGAWISNVCSQSLPYVCAISTIVPVVTCPPCPTIGCPAPPTPPGHCQSGWTYFTKTDACYKYFLWANFDNAENNCKGNNAHLVSIHSVEENNFVSTLAMTGNTYTGYNELTWIGLQQTNYPTNKNWSWTDGTPVDFFSWAPTQPDDAGGTEHCVQIFSDLFGKDPSKDNDYQHWNDITCTENMRAYVCKKKALH